METENKAVTGAGTPPRNDPNANYALYERDREAKREAQSAARDAGQHTPGPWRTDARWEHYAPTPEVYAGTRRIAAIGESHCVCFTEEDVANARLIAAAPETARKLAEAEATIATLLADMRWISTRLEIGGKAARSDAIQQARAAIAQAEGRVTP